MKKIFKKLFSFFLALSLVFTFACSNNTQVNVSATESNEEIVDTDEKVYKIGTLQLVQHEALDNSNKGFFDYLDEKGVKYTNDNENASGEQSATSGGNAATATTSAVSAETVSTVTATSAQSDTTTATTTTKRRRKS